MFILINKDWHIMVISCYTTGFAVHPFPAGAVYKIRRVALKVIPEAGGGDHL